MSSVLVTGASGFIGSAIVRELCARKNGMVRALVRKSSPLINLKGLPVEIVYGDIYYPESLEQAMKGIDTVYHAASIYQFYPWWKRKVAPIYKVNIQGVRNMLSVAKRSEVKKFVYTSSVITVGENADGLSDENTPSGKLQESSHYARTKLTAERMVLDEAKKGFPALVVNPGMVFGEGDIKPTPSGEPIVKCLNQSYPGYFHTIWSVADVRDVAKGHLSASEKGKIGERYILCNREHYSMKQIFKTLEKISKIRAPFIRFPYALLYPFVYIDELTTRWIPRKPILPVEGVRFCQFSLCCDNSKAVRELNYKTTPFEETLERAVKWFRDHGYLKR